MYKIQKGQENSCPIFVLYSIILENAIRIFRQILQLDKNIPPTFSMLNAFFFI